MQKLLLHNCNRVATDIISNQFNHPNRYNPTTNHEPHNCGNRQRCVIRWCSISSSLGAFGFVLACWLLCYSALFRCEHRHMHDPTIVTNEWSHIEAHCCSLLHTSTSGKCGAKVLLRVRPKNESQKFQVVRARGCPFASLCTCPHNPSIVAVCTLRLHTFSGRKQLIVECGNAEKQSKCIHILKSIWRKGEHVNVNMTRRICSLLVTSYTYYRLGC